MSKPGGIPDAWDDDYEAFADSKPLNTAQAAPVAPVRTSRAERKAQHAQANKQLWESAENPEIFHFVEARSQTVPLKSEFKPPLKLLSRKPKPPTTGTNGLETGVNGMSMQDDEDDSEEEARKAQQASLAERQLKAQKEREEKQKKYAAARARLFGTPTQASEIAGAVPRDATVDRIGSSGRKRGGAGGGKRSDQNSSAEQSPARTGNKTRQLYDPDYTEKPGSVYIQKRGDPGTVNKLLDQNQPIRTPKGPDGSGRGGFGFAGRGNKTDPA